MLFLASALFVTAQSNMNCSIYPRLSVPGDMVPLINMFQGNDSHAEYGNLTNYDWTVACKSNITTIGNSCAGTYVNVAQLYNYTDAHVSVNDYYNRKVCFNTSSAYMWEYNVSAVGATPADYECLFSIFDYQDAHVYDCNNVNASYNVNLRIDNVPNCYDTDGDGAYNTSSDPPCPGYRDCNDYNASVLPPHDDLNITQHTWLCPGTFYVNNNISYTWDGIINFYAGNINLTCNNTIIIGNRTGQGIVAAYVQNISITGCSVMRYESPFIIAGTRGSTIKYNTAANATDTGFDMYDAINNSLMHNKVYYCAYGVYFTAGYLRDSTVVYNNTVFNSSTSGIRVSTNPGINVTGNYVNNSRWAFFIQGSNLTLENNVLFNNSVGFNTYNARGLNLTGNIIMNSTQYPVYFQNTNYSRLLNNSIIGGFASGFGMFYASSYNSFERNYVQNCSTGIRFDIGSLYNNVTNNTFYRNNWGADVDSAAHYNLFYYNNFSSSSWAHVRNGASDNWFNTTNNTVSCPGGNWALCARGNFWDDVGVLEIYDTNKDDFGDFGTQYPYSRANGGNVSTLVTDYGPITDKVCYDTDGDGAYNTSSSVYCPGYRDCDDNNASLLPPRNDFAVSGDVTLCSGTFYVNDSGSQGLFQMGNGAALRGNYTYIIGNTTGVGVYGSASRDFTVTGINFSRYMYTIFTTGCINLTITNNVIHNSTWHAIQMWSLNDSNISKNTLYWNWGGVLLQFGSLNNTVSFSNISNNTVGIDIESSNRTVAFNNTIYGNDNGVTLYGTSSGSLFYYNNFTASSTYHVQSFSGSDNYFNTTNTSSCPVAWQYCARGNFWDDIGTLEIYDTNKDGFGDFGTQYPYNSSFSSKVSANVTDRGPMTDKVCYDDDGDGAYNTSSSASCPGYRDCDDSNATLLPPRVGLSVTANITLCSGTYYLNTSGSSAILNFGANNTGIFCNATVILGNKSGNGIMNGPITAGYHKVFGCTVANYSQCIRVGTNSTVFNNTAFSCQYGFFTANYYTNFTNNTAYNSSYGVQVAAPYASLYNNNVSGCVEGLYFSSASYRNQVVGNSIRGNTRGMRLEGCHWNNISNNWIYNNSAGTYVLTTSSNFNNYTGNVVYNNTNGFMDAIGYYNLFINNSVFNNSYGIGLGYYSNTTLNRVENNSVAGIYVYENGNNITNNTIYSNYYGLMFAGFTSGNLVYYNTFSANTNLHVQTQAGDANNYFNTTNTTVSCPGGNWALCARGNIWSGIELLEIYDSNGDGFGDSGSQYPYNSTNGGNVNIYVNDWGPITDKICYDTDGDGAFNTSSTASCPGYRDCDDNNASLLPPRDDLNITANTWLCPGTFYVNNSRTSNGIVNFNKTGINLTCLGTTVIGNRTGYGIYLNRFNHTGMSGCTFSQYYYGIYLYYSVNSTLRNISLSGNRFAGVQSEYSGNSTLSNMSIWNTSGWYGIYLDHSDWTDVFNVSAWDDGYGIGTSTSSNLRFINIDVWNHATGITTSFGTYLNLTNVRSWNSSNNGIFIGSGYSNLTNVSIWDGRSNGLSVRYSYQRLSDIRVWNNTGYGVYLFQSDYSYAYNITSYNNTNGVMIDSDFKTALNKSRVYNNSNYGIMVDGTFNSNVTNTTIANNSYGAYVWSGTGNLFYFNEFRNNSLYHAFAKVTGNYFNTTNTSSCPVAWEFCARGNYWDDLPDIDITDSNSDGFGDSGTEYPYNSTYSALVNENVTDWGPMLLSRAQPINGSIVIFGPNGTVWTGTRSVFLNLSFEASAGIGGCRWANDDPANLNNYPFEECTTVKAWLLSEGEGNKTVYYQIADVDGNNITVSDTIDYRFTQDYTAPHAPVVYDGRYGIDEDDLDWWNSNDTLNAWWSSAEDISEIYYYYRVLNNSACSGSCAWTYAGRNTSVTIRGLDLVEGRNYSVEVIAYNPFGMNASSASDGVIIDLTRPGAPVINSSTHPSQVRAYQSSTARFNWSASDPLGSGVSSGIAGYSWLIDLHSGTAPDSVMDSRSWEQLTGIHKGAYNQTLRTNFTAGNVAYGVFSEVDANFTVGDNVRVKVTLAEQVSDYPDLMGVMVYLMKADFVGDDVDSYDYGTPISNIANVSWDIRYAENMGLARDYQFNLTVNQTTLNSSTDIYVVVKGIQSDNDNRNFLAIAGTTSSYLIDNSTKNWVCADGGSCQRNTTTLDYAISVEREDSGDWSEQYDYLGDGEYYFHVKARDIAGNWGDPAHYRIIVAAGGVSSVIYSPVDGEVFSVNGTERNITVKVSVSGNASTWVVAKQGAIVFTSPKQDCNMTCWFDNVTLQSGQNELYAFTNTTAGAVARSPSIYVLVTNDFIPVTDKTLRVGRSGGSVAGGEISYESGSYFIGIANEDPTGIAGDYVQADTEYNSIKIFMTKPFDAAGVSSKLSQNSFMDQVMPMFGLKRIADSYVIRTELRYPDIYLGGDFYLLPGVYQLYMRKTGIDEQGRYNITFVIG